MYAGYAYGLAKLSLIVCLLLVIAVSANALQITSSGGNWTLSVGQSDLILGAGSNLNSTYTNSASTGALTISDTTGDSDTWRVDVRRTDTNWDSHFTLSIQRTGDGLGSGAVSGGEAIQTINTTDDTFFTGNGNMSNIPVQLQLSGMSLQVPPGTYSTIITYTVVDL